MHTHRTRSVTYRNLEFLNRLILRFGMEFKMSMREMAHAMVVPHPTLQYHLRHLENAKIVLVEHNSTNVCAYKIDEDRAAMWLMAAGFYGDKDVVRAKMEHYLKRWAGIEGAGK